MTREAWVCPRCPEMSATYGPGGSAECAGAIALGTAHEPCAMERLMLREHTTSVELSAAHSTARALRAPVFKRDEPAGAKAPALEEFMLVSAFYSGDLHDERLGLRIDLKPLRERWRDMAGWEGARRGRTNASIDEAKALFNPDLWAQIQDLEWKIAQLSSEIERLERDAKQVSRAYAIAMGQ